VKKRFLALLLLLVLPLCSCQAMLEREQSSVSPHPKDLSLSTDSQLEAKNYQELVSAILYLVSTHTEIGTIRFYDYYGDMETDLATACLEVVQRDPLGAFAVDFIKHELNRIVSYHEATLFISFRRSKEETPPVISVSGVSAIKAELRSALASFVPVVALRVSYFNEDISSLRNLIYQAYYDTPKSALGMPEVSITLYPETGAQRIVEITLTYPEDIETLTHQYRQLESEIPLLLPKGIATPWNLYDTLHRRITPVHSVNHNTIFSSIYNKYANSEGLALAYKLLCDNAGITCVIVQGSLNGEPHFWNIVSTYSGSRHVDLSANLYGLTDAALVSANNYAWGTSYPRCKEA